MEITYRVLLNDWFHLQVVNFPALGWGWNFFHSMKVYNNSSSLGQVSKANTRATTMSCHFIIYHLGHLLLTKRQKELSS